MQIKLSLIVAYTVVMLGCGDQFSGSAGEIKRIKEGKNEYVLVWDKPVGEKSDSIHVKLKCLYEGSTRKEYVVAAYDKLAVPEFTLEFDKITNSVKVVDAFGSKFEFKRE